MESAIFSSPSPSSSAYYTSLGSPMSMEVEKSEKNGYTILQSPYRPAVQITEDVRKHCEILWDEQLYLHILTLLSDLVTPGAAHPECASRPTYAPRPLHIELVSILLVHPRYTNQAPPSERSELSARCIVLLRNILTILGPLNANLSEAFSLDKIIAGRPLRHSRNRVEVEAASSSSDAEDAEKVKGIIANNGRLRNCAKDFWHIVGWAFNCSVKYPQRWKCWKVWLDYMLDVLDKDWNEREARDLGTYTSYPKSVTDLEASSVFRRRSLLVTYLSDAKSRSIAIKRIVRSAFANGSVQSMREFPEVWENETKEVKLEQGQKRKREFGDYGDEDETNIFLDANDQSSPMPSQASEDLEEIQIVDPWLGGTESIMLRQRVLMLLSRVAHYLEDCLTSTRDLYEMMYVCVKPLPVPAFSLLVAPTNSSRLPTVVFVSLTLLCLLRMLPNNAPEPTTMPGVMRDELTQPVLEHCYLPFAASTPSASDNAKVSILVESLFRRLLKHIPVVNTPSLVSAIETGIQAREAKAKGDRRMKNGVRGKDADGSDDDMVWLKASAQRLRSLVAWVEQMDCEA